MRALQPVLALLTASTLLVLTAAHADRQTTDALPERGDVTVQGTVGEVWGHRFVLEDEAGSVLVEIAPRWYHDFRVETGESLRVDGRIQDDAIAAYRVHRDGQTVEVRPEDGPPPWARGRRSSPEAEEPETRPRTERERETPDTASRRDSMGAPHRGLTPEQIELALELALEYGFVAFKEIEKEGRNEVEVEGWLDDEWEAEVDFDLATGRILKEERERSRPPGNALSADDLRQLLRVARDAGMVSFDEIELENGYAEVEGWDADGREMEIDIELPGFRVLEVEYD